MRLSLFPEQLQGLGTDCSCPDWSNPCKHIAAVYYLLGEEFNRDPFIIFRLRGKSREELIGLLGGAGGKTTKMDTRRKSTPTKMEERVPPPPEPLAVDISSFCGGSSLPEDLFGEVRVPSVPAALLKRLGGFPFWRGEERFLDAIESIYTQASPRGLEIFLTWR